METDLREIRRRCQARLDEIPVSARSLDGLMRDLSRSRGRPILVRAVAGIAPVMGLWIAGRALDLIVVEAETSEWHQEHIAAHELAHMLLGHEPRASDASRRLLPDIRPEMVRGVLQRAGGYDAVEEQQAEVLGTLIVSRLAHAADESPGEVLGRLERFAG